MDQYELKQVLDYDPKTGIFRWKQSLTNRVKAGDIAGTTNRRYIEITINGKKYLAHRLAFLYMNGSFPPDEVDHKNGNKLDNRWSNLREVESYVNRQNRVKHKTNTSGYLGVCPCGNKWVAYIGVEGKSKYLGIYNTPEEAYKVRLEEQSKLWKHQPTQRL